MNTVRRYVVMQYYGKTPWGKWVTVTPWLDYSSAICRREVLKAQNRGTGFYIQGRDVPQGVASISLPQDIPMFKYPIKKAKDEWI